MKFINKEDCPKKSKHTKQPKGYMQWHYWVEKKSEKYRQVRCDGCNLLTIWVKKDPKQIRVNL